MAQVPMYVFPADIPSIGPEHTAEHDNDDTDGTNITVTGAASDDEPNEPSNMTDVTIPSAASDTNSRTIRVDINGYNTDDLAASPTEAPGTPNVFDDFQEISSDDRHEISRSEMLRRDNDLRSEMEAQLLEVVAAGAAARLGIENAAKNAMSGREREFFLD